MVAGNPSRPRMYRRQSRDMQRYCGASAPFLSAWSAPRNRRTTAVPLHLVNHVMSISRCADRHVRRSGRVRLHVAARPRPFLLPIEQYSNQRACGRPRVAPHRGNAMERFTIATSAIAARRRSAGKNPTVRAVEPVTSCAGWRLASRADRRSNRTSRVTRVASFRHASLVRATWGTSVPHEGWLARIAARASSATDDAKCCVSVTTARSRPTLSATWPADARRDEHGSLPDRNPATAACSG